jgi:hypothetical protein
VSSEDPTVVRSLAVTADDVVAALAANRQRSADAVLRVTPPFHGRMRARLHRVDQAGEADPVALHVPPERFLDEPPPMPSPDDTEDAVRADPSVTYDAETHRRRHGIALEEWRDGVRDALVEGTTIETPTGPHPVAVSVLE